MSVVSSSPSVIILNVNGLISPIKGYRLNRLKNKQTIQLCVYKRLTLDLRVSVQFSCSVVSDSLRPHEWQHARPPCPSLTSLVGKKRKVFTLRSRIGQRCLLTQQVLNLVLEILSRAIKGEKE